MKSQVTGQWNDHYGHVNALPPLLDHARVKVQARHGLSDAELSRGGVGLFIKAFSMECLSQAKSSYLEVRSAELDYQGGARAHINYEIFCGETLVARASSEHCFVSLQTEKPIKPPAEFLAKLQTVRSQSS